MKGEGGPGFQFREPGLEAVDLGEPANFARVIIEALCGESYRSSLRDHEARLVGELLAAARRDVLDYAQFNELLLLLNQDRVSEPFFRFFFGPRACLEDIRRGVVKFRGFAMLKFGNFRHAYKELIGRDEAALADELEPYSKPTERLLEDFAGRLPIALLVKPVPRDQTWQLGYVAKKIVEDDALWLQTRAQQADRLTEPERRELNRLIERYDEMARGRERLERQALENTDVYLTWDYMDVYVATSMRTRWEFAEAFDFVNQLFSSGELGDLKLRWFDPTQSLSRDRIDKGLVEGLMLKRARCTVYMAQEYDSMGKDSELAATLAQGKPVIAYVPSGTVEDFEGRIVSYPLDFVKRRILLDRAERLFEEKRYRAQFAEIDPEFERTIDEFTAALDRYRRDQPLALWTEKDKEFEVTQGERFRTVRRLLAMAEQLNYESRASLLRESHPLSVQVSLATGVANGVLVVRNVQDCAELLHGVLTNCLRFTIRHVGEEGKGVTVLEEEVSKCPFRVVTDNEKLTNSFWNFYPENARPWR